ncbi:MAG: hypothetical protein FJY82_14785 [Candidatus Aminicenantes bacterium]|nr:hypothetical protein [Candidatus Aminicenantes bacterium]
MARSKLRTAVVPVILFLIPAAGQAPKPNTAAAPPPPPAVKIEVKPTALFIEEAKTLFQRVDVEIEAAAALPAGVLEVRQGAGHVAKVLFPAIPKAGRSVVFVNLPDRAKPVKTAFRLKAGGASAERTITLAPQRKWTLYLLPHSHTDIGYTDLQTRVAKNHVEYLDRVVEFCRVTDGYPEEAKFRWNIVSVR